MLQSMQDWPLLVSKLIDHAAMIAPDREIVTLSVEGPVHRTSWAETRRRARQLAGALRGVGIAPGDRVATLAWNTWRHLECLYGTAGIGAVAHTVNPRLFDEQIIYILNHARDRILLFDTSFAELVARIAPQLETIEHFIVLTDRAHMPQPALPLRCYEEFLATGAADTPWAALDENAPAGLCYTSGTTGNPKGVLYTNRSTVLHSLAAAQVNVFALSTPSVILPVVPMFHANAWGIPYAAALAGAKLVLNGPHHDAPTLQRLIVDEGVTVTAAVPTVWLAMLQHLRATGGNLGQLQRTIIGGSAAPRSMIAGFENAHGIEVIHAWGLTETSPVGTTASLCDHGRTLDAEGQLDLKCKQGRPVFGVEMRVVDDEGRPQPHDGATSGNLQVRGPWVVQRYYLAETAATTGDGWFDTGDIANLDGRAYMHITDRAKDVIKSGGEWISSIELENAAVGCPGVAEAAVIGIPHPKWTERPLLVLVRAAGATPTEADVRAHLAPRIAKWWMPERIEFVDAIPHTATGKIRKTALREMFRDLQPQPAAH